MRLSEADIEFCAKLGLSGGHDIDDDQPRFIHLTWPHDMGAGALCETPRLWGSFQLQDEEDVTCDRCRAMLAELRTKDPMLLGVIGALASRVAALREVAFHAREVIWAEDHPESAASLKGFDPNRDLRVALDREHEGFVAQRSFPKTPKLES